MVGNVLFLLMTRGLSTLRWNNFPRVMDIKHMDNVGATLHTALHLTYLESSTDIDRLYIIKKTIFSSFADLILSDINSGTKNYIQKIDPIVFKDIYSKAFETFGDIGESDIFYEDFFHTILRSDKSYEDSIIYAAKKYVGYFEASTNARVFPEMYEVPLLEIKNELDILEQSLEALKKLRNNKAHEKFLAHIYRLSFAMRWNQYIRTTPISVMSHKVVVCYLSYVIAMTSKDIDNEVMLEMMMKSIYHDVAEVITGDIITPTKNIIPGFREVLEKVEEQMLSDYLFTYIEKDYEVYLRPYILTPFDDELGKLVKYADTTSAYLESLIENSEDDTNIFFKRANDIKKILTQSNNTSVEYILTEIQTHFGVK